MSLDQNFLWLSSEQVSIIWIGLIVIILNTFPVFGFRSLQSFLDLIQKYLLIHVEKSLILDKYGLVVKLISFA